MAYETVLYEKKGHKAIITLNRPQVHNCFSRTMQQELVLIWDDVRRDRDIWVAIVTGAGDRAFCTGGDVREGAEERKVMTQFDRWMEVPGSTLTARQNHVWKPVITAVNGICAGGGFYFVGDSDLVICSENATFFDPHVTHGLVTALIMSIALMGSQERMSAQEAHRIGLVGEVVPLKELLPRAEELADKICMNAPMAVQGTVEAIWKSLEMGRQAALDQGLVIAQRNTFTEDHVEGIRSFVEKRKPQWKNR